VKICTICGERPGVLMCKVCQASYDRTAHRSGDAWEAMAWAANRARRFERKRAKVAGIRAEAEGVRKLAALMRR
jgi:hypothetical protein